MQMRRPIDPGLLPTEDFGALPEIDYDSIEFYECLSRGTYGTVYRAKWKTTGQIVAVKRLLVLEKEAHILSLLRHRNIIQFFAAVTKPPNFCIVTEFASKGSLYGYLHDKQNDDLVFDAIVQWASDIASGIHYLHFDAPVIIVHRDLKSKNVVISSNNVCKLCDFGTSKPLIQTTKMSYVGTMPWMSPEMIQSQPVSEATDTWSYGVILWEIITREVPFERLNEFRIAWMVVENGLRLTIPSSCPEMFADLLRRCWETDAKSRPNFKEILDALNGIRTDDSTSAQTRTFLGKKKEWTLEIQRETERLKEKESELNNKQTKLGEWEQRLRRREQNLEYNRRRELPSYDVNVWTEEDAITWLLKAHFNGVRYEQVTDLANKFRAQQITGERLLMLTETDLANLGVTSPALRWQILREITRLNYDNRRLLNFPPLPQQNGAPAPRTIQARPRDSRRSSSGVASARSIDLTLLFGIYVRLGPGIDSHKWKLLMEVEDDNDQLADHPTIRDVEQLIADVKFMVATPPYVYKVSRAPYVIREWLIGLSGPTRVQCVVSFTDNVRQPMNTSFGFDVDYENRGILVEKYVQLHLQPSISTPRSGGGGLGSSGVVSKASSIALRSYLTPNTSSTSLTLQTNRSSAALAPAWQDRSFSDAVPVVPPPPLETPKRSPLWSQIVTGLLAQNTMASSDGGGTSLVKKQASAPGQTMTKSISAIAAGPQQLNTRAISHDPNFHRTEAAPSFVRPTFGLFEHSSTSTIPKSISQTVSFDGSIVDGLPRANSSSTTADAPARVIPRRGGRVRYPRRTYSRGQSLTTNPSDSSSSAASSTVVVPRQHSRLVEVSDGLNNDQDSNGDDDVLSKPADQSSVMSVQVHGGYQKWKWKH